MGELLAERLGARFIEGDSFHPPANVEKMHAGTPLTDVDRLPWLKAIAAEIDRCVREGEGAVIACSALKRAYRGILVGDHGSAGRPSRGNAGQVKAGCTSGAAALYRRRCYPVQFQALETACRRRRS